MRLEAALLIALLSPALSTSFFLFPLSILLFVLLFSFFSVSRSGDASSVEIEYRMDPRGKKGGENRNKTASIRKKTRRNIKARQISPWLFYIANLLSVTYTTQISLYVCPCVHSCRFYFPSCNISLARSSVFLHPHFFPWPSRRHAYRHS